MEPFVFVIYIFLYDRIIKKQELLFLGEKECLHTCYTKMSNNMAQRGCAYPQLGGDDSSKQLDELYFAL